MRLSILLTFVLLASSALAQMNQTDAQGRKQGDWGKTYPKTKIYQYRGQFKDGKPVGIFTYNYPINKVKAIIKHDPTGNRAVANMFHENGQIMSIGIYRNEKKDSIWRNFGPSGRLSNTETYKADSLHGEKVIYFVPEDINDKRQVVAGRYNYVNGTMEGEFKEFFDDSGTSKNGQYLNGRKHGEWTTYSVSGKPMMFERYKNGVRHGWAIAYGNDGVESNRVYFYKGKQTEGDQLKDLMRQMKEKGINPNE